MQRTSLRLHRVFATLLPGLVVAQAACGGTTSGTSSGSSGSLEDGGLPGNTDGGPRDPLFETLTEKVCLSREEILYGFPKDATLATGVDYIGGYALNRVEGDGGTPTYTLPASPTISVGEACKTAVSKATCAENLGKQPEAGGKVGWSECAGNCEYKPVQVRVTRGDTVTVVTANAEGVVSAYLPIDTATEAVARVAASRQYGSAGCSGKDVLRESDGSYLVYAKATDYKCNPDFKSSTTSVTESVVRVAPDGTMSVVAKNHTQTTDNGCIVAGRRPEGLLHASTSTAFLSRMAHLEAASVVAFEQMIDELRHHGAPQDLIARAEAARCDEVRHAETMTMFATAAGARVPPVEVTRVARGARSLLEMALENVAEGCVRETFGALVAHRQAATAKSDAMRFAMRTIARDETEHAALSWDLHAWLMSQLTDAERAVVEQAYVRAERELERECQAVESERVRDTLGLPSAPESLSLARGLTTQLNAAFVA